MAATAGWRPVTRSLTYQLVVEAVIEDEGLKVDVFRELDKVVADEAAILASNTSSIPIMKLGIATSRPEQVIGIHFFNPVPVLRLVELVTSRHPRRWPPPTGSPPTCCTRR